MKLLIRGGRVFAGGALQKMDVLLRGDVVAQVAERIDAPGAEELDAAGCVLSPGFTDLHVHLRQPGYEAKETIATGTAAAAAGGFTTVCAMPNLSPVPDNAQNLAPQLAAIRQDAVVRVLPYGSITVGQKGEHMADVQALAPFVPGFSDDGRGVQSEDMMRRAMQAAAQSGRFITAHCEVEALLPKDGICVQQGSPLAQTLGAEGVSNESEWREVERNIRLAGETGCRLHICHTSARESFDLVRRAKAKGLPVSCEVTPHNLVLSCMDSEDDGRFKMNPPLRMPEDRAAALQALLDGTADAIATDHAPHTAAEKAGGFARSLNGVVGLETAFAALYTKLVLPGALSLPQLLNLLTEKPRAVLGEAPGRIAPGHPADLVVLDVETKRRVDPERFLSKGRASPFAGMALKGWPVMTVLGGKIVYRAH